MKCILGRRLTGRFWNFPILHDTRKFWADTGTSIASRNDQKLPLYKGCNFTLLGKPEASKLRTQGALKFSILS
jgi:hypothetical protein